MGGERENYAAVLVVVVTVGAGAGGADGVVVVVVVPGAGCGVGGGVLGVGVMFVAHSVEVMVIMFVTSSRVPPKGHPQRAC